MGIVGRNKRYACALVFMFSCLFMCGFCIFADYLSLSSSLYPGGSRLYVGGVGENNYTSIQAALDGSSPGDVIYVYSGVYCEQIIINKEICLEGQGQSTTIIDGQNNGDVITIKQNNVYISGFSIINTGIGNSGLLFDYVTGVIVQYCTIENAYNGFRFISSDENGIYNNSIKNSGNTGMVLDDFCNGNVIAYNNFLNNVPDSAYDEGYDNIWYSTGTGEGNYWDDYEGEDTNGDGIGDVPYEIPGGVSSDLFPLINGYHWIENLPVANFTYFLDNETIYLNASSSYDTEGVISEYSWSFGDGKNSNGIVTNHTYLCNDTFVVGLTVFDNDDNEDSLSKNIFVGNDTYPPEISDTTPGMGYNGETFTFTATLCDIPLAENTGVEYAWVEYWYIITAKKQTSMVPVGNHDWEKTITLNDTFETLHYILLAKDLTGNMNNSDVKQVNIHDSLKPVIKNLTCTPHSGSNPEEINITCHVIDNWNIETVRVDISSPDYSFCNMPMNNIIGTDRYYYNSIYENPGVYHYYVYAIDSSGNINVSAILTFSIYLDDTNPPIVINYSCSPSIIPIDTDGDALWGEMMNISLLISDESNITSVVIDLENLGRPVSFLDHIEGTNIWYITTTAQPGTAIHDGTHYLSLNLDVNVTDEWGNWNLTQINLYVWENGDVSGNGKVTLYDATYLAKWYLNIPGFENLYENVGDVSGNGKVTLYDATYLAKWYLNIPGYEVLK